ncbi:MAG: SDR family NAD(P)-dependent oxidoreductase [Clostridium sp.]|nr:SDR family NAD(P)-dependent oxidoreductase [Clostridium sp.]
MNTLIFGLLEGWWLYEDDFCRIPDTPLLSVESWKQLYEKNLIAMCQIVGEQDGYVTDFYQNVFVGKKQMVKKIGSDKQAEKSVPIENANGSFEDDKKDYVAIIGLSGRFPDAQNAEEFWSNLASGRNSIHEVPADRWDCEKYYDPNPHNMEKSHCKWGGFLRDIDLFDPMFFGISGKEAELTDPQQRIFLTECWKALEDAGYSNEDLNENRCSVYAAALAGDYQECMRNEKIPMDLQSYVGNAASILSSRISYYLNLKGEAITIDTACSSSLVAIALACQSILSGNSDMSLAGGVFLNVGPKFYIQTSNSEMLSSTGVCDAFGNHADGFVPGEGAGVVVLKSLKKALLDGDNIYGVVKGIAINQDGHTNGITAPSAVSQKELELSVYQKADINPETITYIEAHGTGTKLGDPIEVRALTEAFSVYTDKKNYCSLGSVKCNIGHAAMAAGISGIIKILMAMKYKQIPPMINYKTCNEYIDLDNSPFIIDTALREWNSGEVPRRAAISGFGFSGTNVHAVLEEAPEQEIILSEPRTEMFVLSAKNKVALIKYVQKILEYLRRVRSKRVLPDYLFENLIYTLQTGRMQMEERLVVLADNLDDIETQLLLYIDQEDSSKIITGNIKKSKLRNSDMQRTEKEILDSWNRKDYRAIANMWVAGAHIQWKQFYQNEKRKKISLPGYPLDEERYWCLSKKGEMCAKVADDETDVPIVLKKLQWLDSVLQNRKHTKSTVLVMTSDEEYVNQLKVISDCRYITVLPSDDYQKISDSLYHIDWKSSAQCRQLMNDLSNSNIVIQNVIYLHTEFQMEEDILAQLQQDNSLSHEEVCQQVNKYIMPLYYLLHVHQEVYGSSNPLRKILFVYRMVNSVASPFQEAVLGFGCSLKYGRGSTDISVIEVDDENSNCKRMAEIIQTELDNASCDFDVRYIGQKRLVRKLKDIVLEKDNNVPIRRNGCYLITGGLGGLGYVIAKHLAEKYKAKIVLVGRSAYDRSKEQKIEQLQRLGANVFYKSADITKKTEVVQVIKEINEQFGTLHGVFHCAGILDEHSIWEKGERRFLEILQPKITGTVVLDEATRKQPLEFFVLYSSLSSIIGDFEQCDYAVANRFMDSYTVIREQLRKSGLRNGITRTVNWPLWENGGMLLTTEQKATYMSSNTFLTDERGIETLEKILQCKESNVAVLLPKVNRAEHHIEESKAKTVNKQEVKSSVKQSKKEINIEGIRDIIRDGIAELLYLKKEKIEDDESFGMFGFDSISFKDFATWLSDKFQITVSPTCFYAHSTIQQLAEYMVSEFPELMLEEETEPVESEEIAVKNEMGQQGVAIVGMAGLMPEADDIYEFWSNLVDEKDCIKEIPKERWDWREYITNDRHDKRKTVSKWGGFVRNVDCFDAAFFQIPESEAKYIDPQHRLYLQTVWSALEDGGYKPSSLSGKKIGVFTGVQLRDYAELFTDAEQGEPTAIIGTANTMLSNRISYLLNLHGPSESVDTACSSSLVAVHRAVQSIMIGESEMAIAGGVCLDLTPDYYIATSRMGIASATGKCKTFDESADGYVRGEGIGAILLKSLDKAVEDGDFIYAVIKSSATNHGGKASSMTAPNQEAQTALFEDAYRKSVFLPDTISYIEVHGTGTELGDPIEVEALKKAFKHLSKEYGKNIDKKGYCGLGTVKTNIGHLEPASGIAGILKVALALKNGMIPGNLNFKNQNPYINLADSPFYIVKGTKEWKPIKNPDGDAIPRRAGVSSFGFGGTNAHIVLEEYQDDRILNVCEKNSIEVIQFSAKTKESLYAFMLKFRQFISWNNNGAKDAKTCLINCLRNILSKIIHVDRTMIQETELLQDYGVDMIGFSSFMEAINSCVKTKLSTMDFPDFMELSLGQITRTLLKKEGAAVNKWLQESLDTKHPELTLQTIAYTLNVCREAYSERVVILCKDLNELKQKLDKVLSKQVDDGIFLASEVNQKSHGWYRPERSDKVNDIVDACLKGTEIDWTLYYQDPCYYKVSLPAYAFEKKRYWMESDSEKNAQLQCKLIREHAVVADHVVCGETILPGVAQINLMCECIGKVYPKEQITIKDVVWEQKVKVIEPEKTITANFDKENLVVSVTGQGSGKTIKYSEAEVIVREKKQKQWIDIQKIQQRMNQSIEGADIYEAYRRIGLIYGEYYRCVTKVWFNESEAIGKLEIPEKYKEDLKTMEIHPGLVDSALQTAVSILIGQNKLAEETIVPFTVGEVSIYGELTAECYAYAKISKDNSYHVVILDNQGNVVMKLLNITVRKIKASPSYHTVKPVWKEVEMTDYEEDGSIDMSSHHMVIGEDEQLSVYEKECPSVNKVLWTDAMDISSFITAIKRSEKLESITWIAYSKTEAYIDEEFILKAQRKGVVALFYLVKALIQLGYDEEELNWTFITKCTQEVNEKEKINPVFAGMVGFAGSMAKEFINWRVRFIDTNENDDRNNLTKWYKMRPLENGNVYALRDGKYYVEKLGNLSMKMSDVSAYRKNGVYVVIGGAGGLGMIWSKYMIDQYHAQLVWVGRSGMNDKIQKSIDELAHYGRKPVYISADASDVEQLRHVRDFVLKQFGEIHGIVHSALVLEDHTIPNLKEEELEKSLTAKVNISVRMVQVFKKEPLDFIMFFSSLISKTKAAGQSNYAAGCTFVDSYARYLERKLACKIKLVNWGYWSSKGVVADKPGKRV